MKVFITGGTGYMGSRLIPLLVGRGHEVQALVRKGSETKLPAGAIPVVADPLRMDSYTEWVRGADTFVHLKSGEGEGVSGNRSAFGPGRGEGGGRRRHQAVRLSKRGATGKNDAGIYRRAKRRRKVDS